MDLNVEKKPVWYYKLKIKPLKTGTWIYFYADRRIFDSYFNLLLPNDHELVKYLFSGMICEFVPDEYTYTVVDTLPNRYILVKPNSKKFTFVK